ncbi:DUF1642 domain-containing protein [Lactococcus lactis]|uniref:DUF1642 domain-containing protein n=1 Tax=Lactococcus lactis TaxID=1358 RepID=UPI0014781476|nr:DUF1642 domain-containing protein [Lactococcus lactis]
MTKFEEEVKRPANGPLTELNNNMQEVFSQYRKMRQYADYLEYESKQKDERILKLENENSFMRDERTTFDSNGMAVEPKLQQQALPVVPECVAEFIEDCKKEGDCLFGVFADATRVEHDMPDLVYFWLGDEGNNDELFARAWLDGYTVEKPQLFYLREKNTNYYLRKTGNNEYGITPHYSNDYDEKYMHYKFTKQEIDSMQTGSYEIVPVEDGE